MFILCHFAVSRFIYCDAEWYYAECQYGECCYAECRYTECRYAECRDATCACYNLIRYSRYFPCSLPFLSDTQIYHIFLHKVQQFNR